MVQRVRSDFAGEKASEIMWDAGMGGGGPYVHCQCGIDHSVPPPENEYDDWDGVGGFSYMELDGMTFVYECEGCAKKLKRYEDFIWYNKDTIRRYLKQRIDTELRWAEQQKMLNQIAGIDK